MHMDIQINYDYRRDDLETLPLARAARSSCSRARTSPANTEVSVSFVDRRRP